jgi:hypothetical protein
MLSLILSALGCTAAKDQAPHGENRPRGFVLSRLARRWPPDSGRAFFCENDDALFLFNSHRRHMAENGVCFGACFPMVQSSGAFVNAAGQSPCDGI